MTRRESGTLIALAALLAVVASAVAAWANHVYWKSNSPWGDAAAYTYFSFETAERAGALGWGGALADEIAHNGRNPLRTVPVLAVAPSLLKSPHGHLITSTIMLACFLAAAMWTVRERSGSMIYAAFGGLLFLLPRGFFIPEGGHPANLPDLSAAYLAGAALCCLLNSDRARRIGWLVLFGVFASGAALSRYVAAMYLFILAAPVLVAYLAIRWREDGRKAVVRPLLAVGIPVALLALPFLFAWLSENAAFYRTFGYAIGGATLGDSFGYLVGFFKGFYGRSYALVLAATAVLFVVLCRRRGGLWTDAIEPAWFALSHLVFAVVVARVSDDAAVYYYATPGLFLLAVAPMIARASEPPHRLFAALLVGVVLLGGWRFWGRANDLLNPGPSALAAKRFDHDLARALTIDGRRVVWSPFFAERAVAPSVEAAMNFGVLPLSAGQAFFTNHLSHWKGEYAGKSLDEVQEIVYERTCRWVQVAVARRDPEHRSVDFNNDWAESVARFMSRRLAEDPRWVREFELDGPYGPVVGYRNLSPEARTYELRLLRDPAWGLTP